MEFYEPFSRLTKKADNSKLKSHIVTYLPANHILMESNFTETDNETIIEYTAAVAPSEATARIVELIKEFRWDGSARNVTTQVFDDRDNSGGENVIHTNSSQIY